jgi:serine/threonine protein kinase
MGAVYEALDLRLRNTVAVKQLTAEGGDAERAFEQEASILASLRHSALPAVIDYFTEHQASFLVMQYIDGEDLEELRRRRNGRCEQTDVIAWGVDILIVLSYLHRHDPPVLHRDVKPSNLKLTASGEIVLLDFGLAKGRLESVTRYGSDERSILGFTPSYAPPEQHTGQGTDARSDLYAVGATLYHLVTGVMPPPAVERLAARADGRADPLLSADVVLPGLTRGLNETLQRALQLDASARFRTADEMRDALATLRDLNRERPRGTETRAPRRIDAALPSQAAVHSVVDLVVQVRFTSSPRLGLEDWPGRRLPEGIEQASEEFQLEYPLELRTNRRLPARLRLKIVAPDFAVQSTSDYEIEVPPDRYSKRLVVLLTPERVGVCRVCIEVFGSDALHIGTIPIELDAIASPEAAPARQVGHLVLLMVTNDASEAQMMLFEDLASRRLTTSSARGKEYADERARPNAGARARPSLRAWISVAAVLSAVAVLFRWCA